MGYLVGFVNYCDLYLCLCQDYIQVESQSQVNCNFNIFLFHLFISCDSFGYYCIYENFKQDDCLYYCNKNLNDDLNYLYIFIHTLVGFLLYYHLHDVVGYVGYVKVDFFRFFVLNQRNYLHLIKFSFFFIIIFGDNQAAFVQKPSYFKNIVIFYCCIMMENRQLHNFFVAELILITMIIFFSVNLLCFIVKKHQIVFDLFVAGMDIYIDIVVVVVVTNVDVVGYDSQLDVIVFDIFPS